MKRVCAVAWHPHHLEHLIPLCLLLQATLVVASDDLLRMASTLYPPLPILNCGSECESGSVLFELHCRSHLAGFDVVLYSHLLLRHDLARAFGSLHTSPPRVVYCPHGISEKQQRWSALAAWQDVSLFYGDFNLKQLDGWRVRQNLGSFLYMGHLLRRFYEAQPSQILTPELAHTPSLRKPKRRILYAPTWQDRTGASSFQSVCDRLLAGLQDTDCLIIRPHPLIDGSLLSSLQRESAARDNVFVVVDDPRTIPYLVWADVLIADMSSIAYDFLYCDKPMLFLNPAARTDKDCAQTALFQCGPVLGPDDLGQLHWQLDICCAESASWADARRTLYSSVFAEVSDQELRGRLENCFATDAPVWMRDTSMVSDGNYSPEGELRR